VERRTLVEQLAERCIAIEVHAGLQSASREGGQLRDAGGRGVQSLSLPSKEQGDRVLEGCSLRFRSSAPSISMQDRLSGQLPRPSGPSMRCSPR